MRRFAILILGFLWIPSLQATSVLPLTLSQLTDQAGKIFVGRCVSLENVLDERGIPSTQARFEVVEGVKGATTGGTVLIKQFGVSRPPLQVGEGESRVVPMKTMSLSGGSYRTGAEYLLFLYPESDLGFTSPVGGGQGRFEIVSAQSAGLSTEAAVNPLNNRFLETFRDGPVALPDLVREIRKNINP